MNQPSLSPLGAAPWCDAAWVRAAFVGMNAAAEVWRFAARRPVTRGLLAQMSSLATRVVHRDLREVAAGTEVRLSRIATPTRMLIAVPYPPLRLTITGTDPDTGHALCVGWNIRANAIIRSSAC